MACVELDVIPERRLSLDVFLVQGSRSRRRKIVAHHVKRLDRENPQLPLRHRIPK